MTRGTRPLTGWLTAIVLAHLAISFVHGSAHSSAGVLLSASQSAFVYVVILAAPLAGLVILRFSRSAGLWIIALSLLASLIFGVVNHFVLESADHVNRVGPPWQATFTITAWLLAVTEALGSGIALWAIRRTGRVS